MVQGCFQEKLMRSMNSYLSRFMMMTLVVASLAFAGCAQWWQNFKANPIAGILEGTSYAMNALGLADMAFNAWAASNPDAAVGARAQYNAIAGSVRTGIATAQGTLRTAAELRQPEPDRDAVLREGNAALNSLADFLQGLRQPPGSAQDPLMQSAVANLRRAATSR